MLSTRFKKGDGVKGCKVCGIKGYYDEKDCENLRDLSHGPSDRANNLRTIMESLGITQHMASPSPPDDIHNEAAAPNSEQVQLDPEGAEKMTQEHPMIKMDQTERIQIRLVGNNIKKIRLVRKNSKKNMGSQWYKTQWQKTNKYIH